MSTFTEEKLKEFDDSIPHSVFNGDRNDKRRLTILESFRVALLAAEKEGYRRAIWEAKEVVSYLRKIDDVNVGGGQYGHPETDMNVGYNEALKDSCTALTSLEEKL